MPRLLRLPQSVYFDGPGYIYFIRHSASGMYKVGRSINPEGRVRLVCEKGERVRLVHKIEVPEKALWWESHFQAAFQDKHRGGEWFALTSWDIRMVKKVERVRAGVQAFFMWELPPIFRHSRWFDKRKCGLSAPPEVRQRKC